MTDTPTEPEDSSQVGKVMCARCGAGPFNSSQAMRAHDRIHRSTTCEFCGRDMPSNAIGNHKRVCNLNPQRNPINKTTCPDCGKTMRSTSLVKHRATACRKATLRRELKNHQQIKPSKSQEAAPDDATVEVLTLLDLLLPDGIRVDCLPLVDQWRKLTNELIALSRRKL